MTTTLTREVPAVPADLLALKGTKATLFYVSEFGGNSNALRGKVADVLMRQRTTYDPYEPVIGILHKGKRTPIWMFLRSSCLLLSGETALRTDTEMSLENVECVFEGNGCLNFVETGPETVPAVREAIAKNLNPAFRADDQVNVVRRGNPGSHYSQMDYVPLSEIA